MTIPVDEQTVAIWLVAADNGQTWVATLRKEAGGYDIQIFANSKFEKSKHMRGESELQLISKIRRTVQQAMEDAHTDRGWEAIRGARTMEQYMEILRRLPGFKKKAEAVGGG